MKASKQPCQPSPGPSLLAATQAALEATGDEVVSLITFMCPLHSTLPPSCRTISFAIFQFVVPLLSGCFAALSCFIHSKYYIPVSLPYQAQSDAAQWRATARALEGLQRRPGQLDLHGCGAQVSRSAIRAIARDNVRGRASDAAPGGAAYPALLPPTTSIQGLVLVTGRGLHSPNGNGVVKSAVVEELEKHGVAQPLVCAEPAEGEDGGAAWAADFNPGVVSLTAEMLSALS